MPETGRGNRDRRPAATMMNCCLVGNGVKCRQDGVGLGHGRLRPDTNGTSGVQHPRRPQQPVRLDSSTDNYKIWYRRPPCRPLVTAAAAAAFTAAEFISRTRVRREINFGTIQTHLLIREAFRARFAGLLDLHGQIWWVRSLA